MTPTVSVILPVYNGSIFVKEAVISILAQTYTDFELIVIDDGSTDDSYSKLVEFAQGEPRLRIIRRKKNEGIVSALNSGLDLAQGEYVARMDADDIILPERLEKQFYFMKTHSEIGVLGTCAYIIDEQSRKVESIDFPLTNPLIKWALNYYCPILHPSVMVRRSLICEAGGYNPKKLHTEDYDLWARLSSFTGFANLPERLLLLRKHSGNLSVKYRDIQRINSAVISRELIRKTVGLELPVTPLELAWYPERISVSELEILKTAILSLRNNFLDLPNLTSFEKRYLHHETALQLARIARNAPSSISAMEMIVQALLCDPFSGIDILRHAINKLSK